MNKMTTIKDPLTFVGFHPEDDKQPICGVLTEELDGADAPFFYSIDGHLVSITSAARDIVFQVPDAVIKAVEAGAHFYVGNIGGSEESWQAKPYSLQ